MDIDCPDCGGRVELNQNNIIPYHDNGSPIVCAGSGRQVSAASTQPRCACCGAPATCLGSYERCDWAYACDGCCGHGCEDGKCAPLDDPADVLAIVNRMQKQIRELEESDELARAEEREACARVAERHAYVARGSGSPRAKHDEALVIADAIRARSSHLAGQR